MTFVLLGDGITPRLLPSALAIGDKRAAGAPLFLDPVCMYVCMYMYIYICPQKFLNYQLWVYTQKYVA